MVSQRDVNGMYALAKNSKGEWILGMWTSEALYTRDGSNVRICRRKETTRWRYFRETQQYTTEETWQVGDKVAVVNKRGVTEWFYIIDRINAKEDKLTYIIGC